MGELMSALDGLAADDLHAMFGPQLLDRLSLLLSAANRLAAEVTRTLREADVMQASEHDGLKTMASWLYGHGHLSCGAAKLLVRSGRALESLPAVAAAFADGAITAEQVSVIAAVTRPEHVAAAATQGVELTGIDQTLAEVAVTRPHADLGRVVAHYLARLDLDGREPVDPTEGRYLSVFRHDDGRVSGRFELDAVGGEKLLAGIESIVQANRPEGDGRTRAQQQADALVQLMDNQLASGHLPFLRTVKPHLNITIGAPDLFDPAVGHGAARAGFGAWLSAAQAPARALRRGRYPAPAGRRGAAAGHGPHPTDLPAPPPPRRGPPRRALHLRRLPRPHPLVRRPSRPGVAGRPRGDIAGELRPAVRTAPHPGPLRLPDRTRYRRPMAHLPPRRHRDPSPASG